MDNLLLTPEQAAESLHVGRTTLYGLLRDGALRAVHIGRLCRVPHTELVRYVQTLADQSAPDQAELFAPELVRPQAG